MERRDFIKNACILCGAIGAGISLGSLSSCAAYPVYETTAEKDKIIVPLSLFTDSNLQIIRAKAFDYDIALYKETGIKYIAFLLRCTHAANPLKYSGKEFICTLHGSKFDNEGNAIEGPAVRALKRFETIVSNGNITILIG